MKSSKYGNPIAIIKLKIVIIAFGNHNDTGDARRLLFSIIYVCKSVVFLCFRSYCMGFSLEEINKNRN